MNKNLEIDYMLYKLCINQTNLINCGRNKSIIHKQNKPPSNARKQFILPYSKCVVTSKTLNVYYENEVLIIIGIGSAPEYFYERHVFRLYYKRYKFVKYYFFMGSSLKSDVNKKIYEENNVYNDIVIFSFISSYFNLTTQIICTFNWISSKCNNYKWFIHQTSDSYLNIKKIYYFLKDFNKSDCVIGYIKRNINVDQNKNSVFYIPNNITNLKYYPDFPNGPGYFVHKNAIKVINKYIKTTSPKLWMDDVYIGIVISYTNISLIDLKSLFHMTGELFFHNINKYFLVHDLSPSEIYFLEKKY